ncbi:MAG: hypothetical protein RI957_1137 [Verrucomicrobiota bacterium]
MPHFSRYIGVDYSGAKTPDSSLKGLRIYLATPDEAPQEILPPRGSKKYWSRRGIAEWLLEMLLDEKPTLIGIDHGFSFPLEYFTRHQLTLDWDHFLSDFCHHWPTDRCSVDEVRKNLQGHGAERTGHTRWRRITEKRSHGAKSVFHFDVPGSVAKSTHAGLPWLKFLREQRGIKLHFWPFDGWALPVAKSVVTEVYPSLWNRDYPNETRSAHQQDAYAIARWMRDADQTDALGQKFSPQLTDREREIACTEGWILGVP